MSMKMFDVIGPDAPKIVNDNGGKQSASPYFTRGLSPLALLAVSRLLRDGALEYEEDPFGDVTVRNWHKISDAEHIEHALQHILADLTGDDPSHLLHAFCRLMFAVHQRESAVHPVISE